MVWASSSYYRPVQLLQSLSPGLGFLALAAGIGWGFHRWFDPMPPKILAVAVGLVLLRFGPELFADRTPLPLQLLADTWPFADSINEGARGNSVQSDILFEVAPLRHIVGSELRAGRWPLWNRWFGMGMPLLANPQAQVFEPTALISVPWKVPRCLALTSSLRLFLAFTFVFALCRRLGLAPVPSTFGAAAYALGGYLSLWLGWPLAAVAVWAPGVLYGSLSAAERGRPCDLTLTVVCGASLLVAGHPETILYSALGCLGFASWLVMRQANRRRALTRLLLPAVLGVALASPTLLASGQYLPQSHRQELLSRRNLRLARGDAADERPVFQERLAISARQVLPVVAPRGLGSDRTGSFEGPLTGDRTGSGFPGTLALALALAGLSMRLERRWSEVLFGGVAVAAIFVIAKPPGLPAFLAEVPILSSLPNQWSRVSLWFNLAVAISAAHSLDRWIRASLSRYRAGVSAAALVVFFGSIAIFASPPTPVDVSFVWAQAFVAAIAAVVLVTTPSAAKASVITLLAVVELTAFFGSDYSRMPRGQGLPSSELLVDLRGRATDQSPFRIAAIGEVAAPNLAALEGLTDLRVSDPAKPWAPHHLLRTVNKDPRRIGDRFQEADHALFRWLGVRYLVLAPGERLGPPWRRVQRSREGSLYELPDSLPLVFLAREVRRESTARGEIVWLPFERADAAVDPVPARALESDHWAIASASSTPRLLATTIYDDGNWQVLVDGVPVNRVRVQGAFVGADLPAGPRRVDLVYRPTLVVLGAALAAVAIAVLMVAAVPRHS